MNESASAITSTGAPRVILLGEGITALTALHALTASCRVLGVVRTTVAADPVCAYAAETGIPVWGFAGIAGLADLIAQLRPDAVVVSSFNRILPARVLALSRFINVHYAPLPRYRGRANVNWALINGEESAAISIHWVSPGLDDGNILYQEQIAITPSDTAQTLYERLNAIQARELGPAVLRAVAGDAGMAQDHRQATYGCARIPDDGEISWRAPSVVIDRLIRALAPPFPGAFTHLQGRRIVVVHAALPDQAPRFEGRVPGRVVNRSSREGWVDVLTGDGVLRLLEVAADAASVVPAADLIRSTRTTLGLSRLDLLRRIDALESRIARLEARLGAARQPAPHPADVS